MPGFNHVYVKSELTVGAYFCTYITIINLKVAFATNLLACFSSVKESSYETWKKFFYFTSKALFFSRKSSFSILDIQTSWRHQIPNHKKRDKFYWMTCITQFVNETWPVFYTTKKNFVSKTSIKTAAWQLVPDRFVFAKNKAQPLLENEVSEATYIRYVLAKLSKLVQISTLTSSDSFLRMITTNLHIFHRTFRKKLLFCNIT